MYEVDSFSLTDNKMSYFRISTITLYSSIRPGGGRILWISSDGDDRRIFLGFEIFHSGMSLGRKIWQVFFLGGLI